MIHRSVDICCVQISRCDITIAEISVASSTWHETDLTDRCSQTMTGTLMKWMTFYTACHNYPHFVQHIATIHILDWWHLFPVFSIHHLTFQLFTDLLYTFFVVFTWTSFNHPVRVARTRSVHGRKEILPHQWTSDNLFSVFSQLFSDVDLSWSYNAPTDDNFLLSTTNCSCQPTFMPFGLRRGFLAPSRVYACHGQSGMGIFPCSFEVYYKYGSFQ